MTSLKQIEFGCNYCKDVDPNISVARELERYVDELISFSLNNLTKEQTNQIHKITTKILLLRNYFPEMELPSNHAYLLASGTDEFFVEQ